MIDWSKLTAEEAFDIIKDSPRIASVWQYSDITHDYTRNLLWDSKKGYDKTWLTVARVWSSNFEKKIWYASYAYDGDEYQRKALGPFDNRFDAAAAADEFLEGNGWKVCK